MPKKQPLKNPKGGLTAAGRRHFKRKDGSNLKAGVKGAADTPQKMRRKGSFLTRFFTNPSGPMVRPNGEPSRLALSANAWGEPVPKNRSDAARLAEKGRRLLERYDKTKVSKYNTNHASNGRNFSQKNRNLMSVLGKMYVVQTISKESPTVSTVHLETAMGNQKKKKKKKRVKTVSVEEIVKKSSLVSKYNPYHDESGRFSSGGAGRSARNLGIDSLDRRTGSKPRKRSKDDVRGAYKIKEISGRVKRTSKHPSDFAITRGMTGMALRALAGGYKEPKGGKKKLNITRVPARTKRVSQMPKAKRYKKNQID